VILFYDFPKEKKPNLQSSLAIGLDLTHYNIVYNLTIQYNLLLWISLILTYVGECKQIGTI
jgi:hypothetical protein